MSLQFLLIISSIYHDPQHHLVLCASHPHACPQPLSMFSWALPLCLAPSTSKVTHFFTQSCHHNLFLWITFTYLLFLNAALIQCKIVYPLIAHHIHLIILILSCNKIQKQYGTGITISQHAAFHWLCSDVTAYKLIPAKHDSHLVTVISTLQPGLQMMMYVHLQNQL